MAEFQEAIERVIAGPERRSRLITPKEKQVVAYHEAGHAIAMHFLPNHDPVHKVTIVPRGMAGGYTLSLPDEETHLVTKEKFKEQLVALLGGRVAEEIRFGRPCLRRHPPSGRRSFPPLFQVSFHGCCNFPSFQI